MQVDELVCIAVARDEIEAEIICSMLRAESIKCVHQPTDLATANPMLSGGGGWAVPLVAMGVAGVAAVGSVMRGSGGYRRIIVHRENGERALELVSSAADSIEEWNDGEQES